MKFYPYKKGDRKGFFPCETGAHNVLSITWELDVLAILMEGGGAGVLPYLEGEGGGRTVLYPTPPPSN